MNIYDKLFDILKENNIKTINDIDNFQSGDYLTGRDSHDSVWIMDIFKNIQKEMELCSNLLNNDKRKYVTFKNDSEEMLKYACMFPTSSINLTEKFKSWDTAKECCFDIPKSFFRSLLINKNLIQAEIYKILPEMIISTGEGYDVMYGEYETITLAGKQKYWNDKPVGETVNVLSDNAIFLSNERVEKLYFAFPWLYGAKINDYIEIVNKNKLLYEHYCNTILRYAESIHNGDFTSMKQDMDEANLCIKIELDKARHNLLKKGIQTVLSVAFTFVPLATSIPNEQKAFLTTILGSTSLSQIISTCSDEISDLRNIGKSSPFWLMYQWNKKVKI